MRLLKITFFAFLLYFFSIHVNLFAQVTLGYNYDETAPLVSPDMMTYNSGMELYEFTVTGGPGYCRLMPSSLPFTYFFMTPIPVQIFFYPNGPLIDCSEFSGDLVISDLQYGTTSLIMNFMDAANHTMYVTSDQVLPVELVSFSAKNNGDNVLLEWKTATEVDNYGFSIQRALVETQHAASLQFNDIGFIEGSGNSNATKEYSFVDSNPTGGSKFSYRLKQINTDGSYEYSDEIEVEIIPTKNELYQNYPNPFNPTTSIKYQLSNIEQVSLKVYDILGREVSTIIDNIHEPGNYSVVFDASNIPSGIYFYTLTCGEFTQTKKMILLR